MPTLAVRPAQSSLDTRSVSVLLGALEYIHDQLCDDDITEPIADTVGHAIGQLEELRRLAYETMLEIESERASAGRLRRSSGGRSN